MGGRDIYSLFEYEVLKKILKATSCVEIFHNLIHVMKLDSCREKLKVAYRNSPYNYVSIHII